MPCVGEIVQWLQTQTPLELGEEWDNVGLLLGDPAADRHRRIVVHKG